MSSTAFRLWPILALVACAEPTSLEAPGPPEAAVDGGSPSVEAGEGAVDDASSLDAGTEGGEAAGPPDAGGLLVGYYASWRPDAGVGAIDWGGLTHLAQAFAIPAADGGGLANEATFPDDALVSEAHAHGVKVVASVGGAGATFDAAVATTAARARTVLALTNLCDQHQYDGIDIDWEFPSKATVPDWVALLDDLRASLDAVRPGLSLSSTVGREPRTADVYPVASLAKLTWVGAMTYRYTGSTDTTVGYYAPLDPVTDGGSSVSVSIDHLLSRGVPASRLLLGLGFYGEQFADGPPGTPISSTSAVTVLSQQQLAALQADTSWSAAWEETASEPTLSKAAAWVSYEDPRAIGAKCAFARSRGLAGALVWHLGFGVLADGSQPLLGSAGACR